MNFIEDEHLEFIELVASNKVLSSILALDCKNM
jgi:hypothetical protein